MANVDRPSGFTPVKTISGAPVSGLIRAVGVADSADIFIGDALKLSSGLAIPVTASNDITIGVAVGIGKFGTDGFPAGPYDPANLTQKFYDDSVSTHTDYCVYYVPTHDVLFEAQFDGTPTTPVIGQGYGLIYTAGNTTSGRSAQEIDGDGTTNKDVMIVEFLQTPGNDKAAAFGRVLVMFDSGYNELAAAL